MNIALKMAAVPVAAILIIIGVALYVQLLAEVSLLSKRKKLLYRATSVVLVSGGLILCLLIS